MKRALAERAKRKEQADNLLHQKNAPDHSGGGSSNSGGAPSTSLSVATPGMIHTYQHQQMMTEDQQQQQQQAMATRVKASPTIQPPRKIPRIKSSHSPRTPSSRTNPPSTKKNKLNGGGSSNTGNMNSKSRRQNKVSIPATVSSSNASTSNPKKRSRPSSGSNNPSFLRSPLPLPTIDDDEEDDENEATNTKFYLKHQNRALASELYRYKHAITILERERNVRRNECKLINEVMRDIVSDWNGMEGLMLGALENGESDRNAKVILMTSLSSMGPSTSSGKGNDVENVYSIMQTIIQLSNSCVTFQTDEEIVSSQQDLLMNDNSDRNQNKIKIRKPQNHLDRDNNSKSKDAKYLLETDSAAEQQFLNHFSNAATSFSKRISNFQRLILNLVQQSLRHSDSSTSTNALELQHNQKYMKELLKFSELKKKVVKLQNNCQDLEVKMIDLAKDRDVAKNSERKVRRGLYRVASGRMKITEALKAVEESSSLGIKDLAELQKDLLSASSAKGLADSSGDLNSATGAQGAPIGTENNNLSAIVIDGKTYNIDDVMQMKKTIDDLTLVNESRDKKISELMTEKESQEKKITDLLAQATVESVKEDQIKSSPLFIEISNKLLVIKRENEKLKAELQSAMDRWAITKGNLVQSRKTVDDLEEKHKRRLKELSGETEGSNNTEKTEHAKRVVQLEHKLKHALDSVRQAEALKSSLIDATTMKETLQRRINELKANNDQLEAYRGESNQELLTSRDEHISKEKVERMRKELSATMQNNKSAKSRLEMLEKEKESLLAINIRLQQQMVDKEDMNAKSLSTILHLRQLSEQIEQEKGILEKKLKSAEQLSVMARLAANAKEKVEREAIHEKEAADEEAKQLRRDFDEIVKQKDEIQGELSLMKAQTQKARDDLIVLKKRCDELVSVSKEKEKQVNKLTEDLLIEKKDTVEAIQKATVSNALSSGTQKEFNSEFTAEQLTIQVNQLKNRIACPVCNTRDKKVIINRCRHMFCRHCVETNLENRNRKCPSCGIRFDKKDVEDVWF